MVALTQQRQRIIRMEVKGDPRKITVLSGENGSGRSFFQKTRITEDF